MKRKSKKMKLKIKTKVFRTIQCNVFVLLDAISEQGSAGWRERDDWPLERLTSLYKPSILLSLLRHPLTFLISKKMLTSFIKINIYLNMGNFT